MDYLLFRQTFELLKRHRSDDPIRALVNEKGQPLKWEQIRSDGKLVKKDNIKSAFDRLLGKLKRESTDSKSDSAVVSGVTLKQLRKTSPSRLAEHPTYGRFGQYFLGQAPTSVADKHYIQPPQNLFDESLRWLEKRYGLG